MVRNAYSFILRYYTPVNVPVVVTSFSLFHRMKEDFMGLYLVRESKLVIYGFLSNCRKDDNFMELYLVRKSKSVRIGRVQPSCCTIIYVIYGVKM